MAGKPGVLSSLRQEWLLAVAFATTALFLLFGKGWLADLSNPLWFALMLVWLFAVILSSAFAVVHHAESLAVKLGEPLGTLVLTLSVIGIEVMMISAVMLTGESKPTLARDTMYGIVMIVLNGMIGVALLVGGLRHHEQEYNLQGANSFLSLIVPLTVLGLVLPNFTNASPGPTLSTFQSTFLAVMSIGIYSLFLIIQNRRHRDYFVRPARARALEAQNDAQNEAQAHGPTNSLTYHAVLLAMYLLPVIVLAEEIALPIDHGIEVLHAPLALGGFLVAVLILSPESLSATRAALANDLHSRGFDDWHDYRQDRNAWTAAAGYGFAGSYPGDVRPHLHQQSHQCSIGRNAPSALSRLRHADLRALDCTSCRGGFTYTQSCAVSK